MQFTPDQEAFRAAVREFVGKELPPGFGRKCDMEQRAPLEVYRKLASLGYLGLGIPEEYGGTGGDVVDITMLLEELGRGMVSFAIMVYRSAMHGAQSLLTYGSEEQRQRFLPGLISGEILTCLSLTEPEAGSDAANVQIRAVRDGDHYVLNGQKIFNSSAHIANYIVLVARTRTDVPKHKGISMFFVDPKTPGVEVRRIQTLGERAVGTNQVFYDNVRVPASNLIGAENNGWNHLMTNLEKERLSCAAWCVGAAQSILDQAVAHARQRVQFGKPIGAFQAIQHKIAEIAMEVHQGRLLIYDLAEKILHKQRCRMEASITKTFCTEMYNRASSAGLQVLGGYGYTMESDMQLHYRDSRIFMIGAGSSEILRTAIAKELGLPMG